MHLHLVALLLSSGALSASTDSARRDSLERTAISEPRGTTSSAVGPLLSRLRSGEDGRARGDTGRVVAVEYSDWYGRRLTIHKTASYAMLPLFAFQYAAGRELYENSSAAPAWAKTGHRIAATGVAALFTVNTVTGVWNLWDARHDAEGRKRRTAHAVLMLIGDAGFTATGLLADRAERSPDDRRLHRTIAISSVAVTTVSYLMMLSPFRKD